jgi:hypothetical protein
MELALCGGARNQKLDVLVWCDPHHSRVPLHPLPRRVPAAAGGQKIPVLRPDTVQTPDPYQPPGPEQEDWLTPQPRPARSFDDLSRLGFRLTWVSGLVLAISAFTDWYVGSGPGPTTSVIGWHTGALGKLVFFIGLAVLALVILRESGIELPATVPESLVVIALGALSTVFVLIRLISVPDEFFGWRGRGIGIFISLLASLIVIVAGLLRAGEEM